MLVIFIKIILTNMALKATDDQYIPTRGIKGIISE